MEKRIKNDKRSRGVMLEIRKQNVIYDLVAMILDDIITHFVYRKNDETPLHLYFRGFNEGEVEAIFSSDEDLIFTVNGARADSFPTAPGEYEVRIDYSKFITKCDRMDTFLHIKDFGHFSLNGEGLRVEGIGDISEWESLPFDLPENFSTWFD